MALRATIGQMRTRIIVKRLTESVNDNGFPVKEWTPIVGGHIWCYWHNEVSNEKDQDDRLELKQPAALTVRYTPLIDVRCRVWLEDDPQDEYHAYEVISVNNWDMKYKFLELKVRRVVVA